MDFKIKYATSIIKDMDESIKFYKEVLGFEIDSQYYPPIPGSMITLMKGDGDTMIELIQNPQLDIGFYSVGMEVDDLDAALNELKSKGVKITGGPAKTLVGHLAFVEDPNGVRICLIHHHD